MVLSEDVSAGSYLVFAHLRRAGYSVGGCRPGSKAVATAGAEASVASSCGGGNEHVQGASNLNSEWLLLRQASGRGMRPKALARPEATASALPARMPATPHRGQAAVCEGCWELGQTARVCESGEPPASLRPPVVHVVGPNEAILGILDHLPSESPAALASALCQDQPDERGHESLPIFAVSDAGSGSSPAFVQLAAPWHPSSRRTEGAGTRAQALRGAGAGSSAEAASGRGPGGQLSAAGGGAGASRPAAPTEEAAADAARAQEYAALRESVACLVATSSAMMSGSPKEVAKERRTMKRPRSFEGEEAWLS